MRAVVTGQVGMDKKSYLDAVADLAGRRGSRIDVYHVGDMMYAESPDVRPGRRSAASRRCGGRCSRTSSPARRRRRHTPT
jgi:hypothetical protein